MTPLSAPSEATEAVPLGGETSAGKTSGHGAPRGEFFPGVMAARFVAAVMIAWIHGPESQDLEATKQVARFATPFFASAGIFFLIRGAIRRPDRAFGPYAAEKFRRLYLPFLGWTLVYLVARNVKRWGLTGEPPVQLNPDWFLVGTSSQLWFLPFILLGLVACFPLSNLVLLPRRRALGAAGILSLVAMAFAATPLPGWAMEEAFASRFAASSWAFIPSLAWGAALAVAWDHLPLKRMGGKGAVFGLLLTAGATAAMAFVPSMHPLRGLAGLGWLVVALCVPRSGFIDRLGRPGRYAFGIYLSHVLFTEWMQTLARVGGHSIDVGLDVAIVATSVILAIAASSLLTRSRWTAWLVPGVR